jgi:hypothetical protein
MKTIVTTLFIGVLLITGCTGPRSAESRVYETGYRDGQGDAVKDRYWSLRYQHHPDAPEGADRVTEYPVPFPEHELNGSRIQPTTRNLIIQQ